MDFSPTTTLDNWSMLGCGIYCNMKMIMVELRILEFGLGIGFAFVFISNNNNHGNSNNIIIKIIKENLHLGFWI